MTTCPVCRKALGHCPGCGKEIGENVMCFKGKHLHLCGDLECAREMKKEGKI